MAEPLISVCLITYNHFNYIRLAIDSVLSQKLDVPWEFIIADDSSTDGTAEIVADYKRQYPDLIRLVVHEKNLGPGLNFVNLINSTEGKYIAYLEGDDYWIDDLKLWKQYKFLEENEQISICYHQVKWVDSFGMDLQWNDIKPGTPTNAYDPAVSKMSDLLEKGWFMRSCSLFFRTIYLPHGFDKLMSGDYALHVLLAAHGDIGFLKELMGAYRIHDKSASGMDLSSISIQKRKENFRREIDTVRYLDEKTNYRYSLGMRRRMANFAVDHLIVLTKIKKRILLTEMFFAFKNIGFVAVTKQLLKTTLKTTPLAVRKVFRLKD